MHLFGGLDRIDIKILELLYSAILRTSASTDVTDNLLRVAASVSALRPFSR